MKRNKDIEFGRMETGKINFENTIDILVRDAG